MGLEDMLGLAKFSSMAGHTAVYGDYFSMVKGAHSNLKKGLKPQHYPISPPDNEKHEYNPGQIVYNILPIANTKSI
jgi:hypothetical protein